MNKPRWLFVVLTIMILSLACNLPMATTSGTGTGTPTGALDVLTLAAQTVSAAETQTAVTLTPGAGQQTSTPPNQSSSSTPTNTGVPPTNTPEPCDQAAFIQDVTVPDGTKMLPGQAFTKTWRVQNIGTCTWNTSYAMVFSGGNSMGAPAIINLPGNVPPNSLVDLSIDMKAPTAPGKYYGNWKLRNSTGTVFGISGSGPIFVSIEVVAPTLTPTITPTVTITPTITITPTVTSTPSTGVIYPFANSGNLCKAQWRSQSGVLNCSTTTATAGTVNDPKGYAQILQNPKLENGQTETNPVLLMVPDNTKTGAITGTYPSITIQQGYHFQTSIGCMQGASQCSVIYQVNYIVNNGQPQNLGQFSHTYNGTMQSVDIDLSSLAGQSVQVVLAVLANGNSEGDQAVWVNPRIVKSAGSAYP